MSDVELRAGHIDGLLHLSGPLTFDTATDAIAAGDRWLTGQAQARIDLSGVSHADSAGLAVLVDWLATARDEGGELVFESPPAQLTAIARVSGVESLLSFDDGGNTDAASKPSPME